MLIPCSRSFIVASLHHKRLLHLFFFRSSSQVPVLRLNSNYVVFATLTRVAKSGITVVIVIYSMHAWL